MAQDEAETLVNEVGARLMAGDFDGYDRIVATPFVRVGKAETGVFTDRSGQRRVFDRTALMARAAGWDSFGFQMLGTVAVGASSLFTRFFMSPSRDGRVGPGRVEGALLSRAGDGLVLRARLNTSGEGHPSRLGWMPGKEPLEDQAPGVIAAVQGLQQGLQQGDIARFLASVTLPLVVLHDDGLTVARNAGEAAQLLAAYRRLNTEIASYDSELVDMLPCGRMLIAARFRIRSQMRDGGEVDPYTNLYFLRRSREGWRVALSFNAAIGRHLPPPPPLGRNTQ